MENFGTLLRRLRKAKKLTLGDVAERLDYTIAYVSDVERTKRAPFTDDKLQVLAELLDCDLEDFRRAAKLTKGVTLDTVDGSDAEQEAALALARTWGRIDDDKLRKIIELLGDG